MKKVIFYMGAGASRGCLPIVSELPERLRRIIDIFKSDEFELDSEPFDIVQEKTQFELLQELILDFEWLLTHCSTHASIDTFAKKLWIRGSKSGDEYTKLKLVLSIYFICEQMLNPPDKRYDLFYASILKNSFQDLPKNVNIVSWNYDYQFEISFYEYTGHKNLEFSQNLLGVRSKYSSDNYQNTEKFNIYKLNGTTVLNDGFGFREYTYIPNINVEIDREVIKSFTRSYAAGKYLNGQANPSLSFAWEEERNKEGVLSLAESRMKESELLVIIGYSFPFFNREIDKRLLGSMENLKKVFIQSPDADDVEERMLAARDNWDNITIKKVYGVNQFYIPNEM